MSYTIQSLVATRAFLSILFFIIFTGYCKEASAASDCDTGERASYSGQFQLAINALSTCLESSDLNDVNRVRLLEIRAWSNFSLRHALAAVSDQEAAFKIKAPTEYREFINYSSYLRRVERYDDSLLALRSAEKFDQKNSQVSMMTQYNLGWTLFKLGRYEEAVEAFNRGIPQQPDYPFVYWRRGLALEALGRKEDARKDFETSAILIVTAKIKPTEESLAPIRPKLRQYGLDTKYIF